MDLIIRAKLVKLTRKKINCIFTIYHTIGLYCISQHITTHRAKLLVNLVCTCSGWSSWAYKWFDRNLSAAWCLKKSGGTHGRRRGTSGFKTGCTVSTYYLLIPLYSFTWFCDCAQKWNRWCNHITTVLDPEATTHWWYHTIVVCPLPSFTSHIVFFSINYITDTQPAHHGNGRNSVHRLSYPSRLEPPCCQQQLAAAGIFLG